MFLVFILAFSVYATEDKYVITTTEEASLKDLSERLKIKGREVDVRQIDTRKGWEERKKVYDPRPSKEIPQKDRKGRFQIGTTVSLFNIWGVESRYWFSERIGLQIYQNVYSKKFEWFKKTTTDEYVSDPWTLLGLVFKIGESEKYRFSLFGEIPLINSYKGNLFGGLMFEQFNGPFYYVGKIGYFPFFLSFGSGVSLF